MTFLHVVVEWSRENGMMSDGFVEKIIIILSLKDDQKSPRHTRSRAKSAEIFLGEGSTSSAGMENANSSFSLDDTWVCSKQQCKWRKRSRSMLFPILRASFEIVRERNSEWSSKSPTVQPQNSSFMFYTYIILHVRFRFQLKCSAT